MIVSIVAGAGKGIRMQNGNTNKLFNKLFIDIGGKPILFYTLKRLDECEYIDEIYLVLDKESIRTKIKEIQEFKIKKLKKIIPGGTTRGESVYNGLKELKDDTELVVIHDGARPFISKSKIKEVIDAARREDGAILAIPIRDTLKEKRDSFISKTIHRDTLVRAQTPQVFKYSLLKEVYEKLGKKIGFSNTDDSYIMEKCGYKIKIVNGEDKNIKITTPFDLKLAEIIIKEEGV